MGAGYAGLSAARALSKNNLHDFKILEATAHVGGRTRNIDARDLRMDTTSDHVLEMGGTFVSPGHLLAFANGGIFRTGDGVLVPGGPQWTPALDGQPIACTSISAMEADASGKTVLAGCGSATSSEMGYDWMV